MKRRIRIAAVLSLLAALFGAGIGRTSAQDNTYFNTFDGELIDWKADSGWTSGGGQLTGTFGEAYYAAQAWDDLDETFVVRFLSGEMSALLRYDGKAALAVHLTMTDNGVLVVVIREDTTNEGTVLGRAQLKVGPADLKANGLTMEVTLIGDSVKVAANGETVIETTDKQPLPAGWIGFRLLGEGPSVQIDEVSVNPASAVTETPHEVDLSVDKVAIEQFQKGSTIIVFGISISNHGNAASAGFDLLLADDQDGTNTSIPIAPLEGGESRSVTLSLEGPDEWQQTRRQFTVTLDPDNTLDDLDRGNNTLTTDPVDVPLLTGPNPVPGPQPTGSTGGGINLLLVGGAALGIFGMGAVAVATILAIRQQINIGERRKYEKMAQKGKPPDQCTPPGIHVELETSLDFKPMHITEIVLTARDTGRESVRRKESIKGGVNNTLRLAIVDQWLRAQNAPTAERSSEIAKGISKTLTDMFMRESGRCDLAITAHLEGIGMTATFTLYRCVRQGAGNVWKKVKKWDKTTSQNRDDEIALLADKDPQATLLTGGFTAELTPLVRNYIERY